MRPIDKKRPDYFVEALQSEGVEARTTIQNALIDAMGNYCSYCEMPLSGYQIEHHRSRAQWQPQIAFSDWDDLLLICNDCRSHIQKKELGADEVENLFWPDRDHVFGVHGQSPIRYESREVKFRVEDADGNPGEPELRQLVFAVANENCADAIRSKVQNTIDHFQLNMPGTFYHPETNEFIVPRNEYLQRTDNRIYKRTEAWNDAMASAERLKQMEEYNQVSGIESMKQLLKKQISMNAYFSGNWSVWMTVFNQEFSDHALLHELFIADQRYFPGTDESTHLFSAE